MSSPAVKLSLRFCMLTVSRRYYHSIFSIFLLFTETKKYNGKNLMCKCSNQFIKEGEPISRTPRSHMRPPHRVHTRTPRGIALTAPRAPSRPSDHCLAVAQRLASAASMTRASYILDVPTNASCCGFVDFPERKFILRSCIFSAFHPRWPLVWTLKCKQRSPCRGQAAVGGVIHKGRFPPSTLAHRRTQCERQTRRPNTIPGERRPAPVRRDSRGRGPLKRN